MKIKKTPEPAGRVYVLPAAGKTKLTRAVGREKEDER
jgi:hypothetical protein